eukprot:366395-Chlamydomonas_euryale.AAC.12
MKKQSEAAQASTRGRVPSPSSPCLPDHESIVVRVRGTGSGPESVISVLDAASSGVCGRSTHSKHHPERSCAALCYAVKCA